MLAESRKSKWKPFDIWPGYVDALSALLMVIIFVLLTFVLAQFSLSQLLNDKDVKVENLEGSLSSLKFHLSQLESEKAVDRKLISSLQNTLMTLKTHMRESDLEKEDLKKTLIEHKDLLGLRENELIKLNKHLLEIEETLRVTLDDKVVLRRKYEDENEKALALESQVADLEKDAQAYQSLRAFSKHRSAFFDKLIKVLGTREDVRVVGDRFVFQSEVLFDSATADIGEEGRVKLDKLATALKEISKKIGNDTPWILRVDGHTDARPIKNNKYPSNWELSSARAISVVRYLISKGIDAKHLVAAGFGENRPIDKNKKSAKNRRIEFKLDKD